MKLAPWIAVAVLAPSLNASARALPIQNDDYAHARAEAKQRHLPLFVDVWAPW